MLRRKKRRRLQSLLVISRPSHQVSDICFREQDIALRALDIIRRCRVDLHL